MAQAYAQPLRQAAAGMISKERASGFLLFGLVIMCLWPRFFYIGVLGKGVSVYYLVSYVLTLDVIRRLATSASLQKRFASTIRANWPPLTLFLVYHVIRIYCDIQGENVLHSLAITFVQTFSESIWLIIAIVYLNSLEKITQAYRVLVFCGVMFFIFAGIEFAYQRPLLTVLRLNNLAVGDKNLLGALDAASSAVGEFRIKGIFVHPIIFGQIAGAFAPLAFHAWRYGGRLEKVAAVLILLGELALPSLTGARTGLVSPIIALFIYFVAFTLQIRNWRRFIALIVAVLFVAAASPIIIDAATSVVVGQDSIKQGSTRIREIQFDYGQSAIERRPLFGYGSDTSLKYAGVEGRNNIRTIDNYYLSEGIDHGLVGLALFLALELSLFYLCFSTATRQQDDTLRSLFSAIAALVATPAVGLSAASLSSGLTFVFFAAGTILSWRGVLAYRTVLQQRQAIYLAQAQRRAAREAAR